VRGCGALCGGHPRRIDRGRSGRSAGGETPDIAIDTKFATAAGKALTADDFQLVKVLGKGSFGKARARARERSPPPSSSSSRGHRIRAIVLLVALRFSCLRLALPPPPPRPDEGIAPRRLGACRAAAARSAACAAAGFLGRGLASRRASASARANK